VIVDVGGFDIVRIVAVAPVVRQMGEPVVISMPVFILRALGQEAAVRVDLHDPDPGRVRAIDQPVSPLIIRKHSRIDGERLVISVGFNHVVVHRCPRYFTVCNGTPGETDTRAVIRLVMYCRVVQAIAIFRSLNDTRRPVGGVPQVPVRVVAVVEIVTEEVPVAIIQAVGPPFDGACIEMQRTPHPNQLGRIVYVRQNEWVVH
jgi:hypothetical protein